MASVRIDDYQDARFKILGKLIGTNRFDALGRMAAVWEYCTDKQTYWVSEIILDALAETENFANALVKSDLAEITDKGIRIKGTEGRIEWLTKLRSGAKKGGKARTRSAKRDEKGQLAPNPAPTQPSSSPSPAQSSPLTLSPSLTNINTNTYVPQEKFRDLWNQNRGRLPEVRELSHKRIQAIKARLADKPDLSYWQEVIARMAASRFCRGETGGTWRANFDWLLQPDSHIKVLEGQYDGSGRGPPAINTTPLRLEEIQ